MKQYNIVTRSCEALPRSKRLRTYGEGSRGGSAITLGGGDGHTHNNKSTLDAQSIDAEGYLYLKYKPEGSDDSLVTKIKAGFADNASALDNHDSSYFAKATELAEFKELFSSMFEFDSNNNAIKVKSSLYSVGAVSAKGIGSGGSNSGGGVSYNRLDSWADYTSDKAGYVLSALLGYDLNTRLSSVEGDYATKDFVNNKLINYATIGSVTAIQNTLTGQIGAVGASVEQLAATKLDSSYFTLANIKSTLGISDWALASAKPTYTASEVGALSVSKELNSGSLNDYTTAGIYRFNSISDGSEGMGPYGNLLVVKGGTYDTLAQLYFNYYDGKAFIRSSNTSGLSSANWNTIAFTSDIPTKLSQLTDDVVDGKYLRATIYGNFDADTLFNDGFRSGYMSHLPSGLPYGIVHTLSYRGGSNNAKPDFASQIFIPCGDDNTSPNDMFFRTSLADSWNGWNKVITDKNIGNYNAGSATKLATPCKLWGQRFDGTGDVSGTFRQLYTGSYDGAVAHSILCNINGPYGLITRINGNGDVLQQAQRETTEVEWFNFILQPLGGNVGIGNTSPTERLDVSGNIKASGNINATSITINGVTITASNGSITVNGNVIATGSITAKKSA